MTEEIAAPVTRYRLTRYHVSLVRDSAEVKEGTRQPRTIADVALMCSDMRLLDREQLRTYFLDARGNVIGWEMVSIGTLTASLAHPREILKGAILSNAAGFILAHNHPSGDRLPSDEDRRLTERLKQASEIMGIHLWDHVVISETGCYSFKGAGLL